MRFVVKLVGGFLPLLVALLAQVILGTLLARIPRLSDRKSMAVVAGKVNVVEGNFLPSERIHEEHKWWVKFFAAVLGIAVGNSQFKWSIGNQLAVLFRIPVE